MSSTRNLVAASLLAVAAQAAAQEIVLFQNENYNGPRYAASSSVSDLARVGFNDRASSATIRGGSWQLCTDAYFRGQCTTLSPGNYPSLAAMGINNQISSLREIGWSGGGDRPGNGGGGGGGFGGGSITLYDSPGISGRSFTVNRTLNNFDGTGFNDRAASAVVSSGTWQLCSDADFAGSCNVFGPGRYNDLFGVTGRVSSARQMADGGGNNNNNNNWNGGGGGNNNWNGGGGSWGGSTRVVLYEGSNFQGRSFTVNQDVMRNLGSTGFNDRASSMRVERGYWMFCTDADFGGECRTFGPGDYSSLSWLSNKISSGRRISDDYPYNAPPRWGN